jgi:hypothetical protein
VITIPHGLITTEAKEVINDATVGRGELDLIGVRTHEPMLAASRNARLNLLT